MISINQFITLAVAAATLLFASACGQSSSPALKVKVASLERCGATQPTIDLVKNTAKELGLDIDFQYVAITRQPNYPDKWTGHRAGSTQCRSVWNCLKKIRGIGGASKRYACSCF
jgi:hypothetical protein